MIRRTFLPAKAQRVDQNTLEPIDSAPYENPQRGEQP